MIFGSINLRDVQKKGYTKKNNLTKTTIINGQLLVNGQQQQQIQIMRATEVLVSNDCCSFPAGDKNNLAQANKLLQTIGCTVVNNVDKSFSLLDNQDDEQEMGNPNIVDLKALKKMKNKQIKADAAFPNPEDSINTFDDPPPRNIQLQDEGRTQRAKSTQKILLSAHLSAVNMGDSRNKLKYFK